jgi:protein-disulfide isomerase
LLTGNGRAAPAQAFDAETPDGRTVRNFRIEPSLSPSNLPGVILSGPAGADWVLYEFFDYACSYCRAAAQDLDMLLGPGAGVRLGLVQHPILSPRSTEAARIVLAAAKLLGDGPAYRLHTGLFEAPGKASEEKALSVASQQGLDAGALQRAAQDADIAATLSAHIERANALSLPYTPSFVLGDFAFAGWPGAEMAEAFFAAMRRCGGLVCKTP